MAGDSRDPPLSRRVPGATKRPTPEMRRSAPVLPANLLERLRAEMGEAQARAEPEAQLPAERPERSTSVPLQVSGADDGPTRLGRVKRRVLRDTKARGAGDLPDVRRQIPALSGSADAEVRSPAAETVSPQPDLATPDAEIADLPQRKTTLPKLPTRAESLPGQKPTATNVPELPTPAELAKMAAALAASAPHRADITQPIPAISSATEAEVARPDVGGINAQPDPAAADAETTVTPERQTTARPLPTRAKRPKSPRGQVPPPVDVPRLPTPPKLPETAAALAAPAPQIEDITQPIPAIPAVTKAVPVADTVTVPKPDLAAADAAPPATKPVAPPDRHAEKAADRKKRHAPPKPAARQRRPRRRPGTVPAAPQMNAELMLRPLFAEADTGTIEEVVASLRVQQDAKRTGRHYRIAGVLVSVLVITIVMVLVAVR